MFNQMEYHDTHSAKGFKYCLTLVMYSFEAKYALDCANHYA